MSIQAISRALAVTGVTPSEKLLLLALANYADPKMVCFPSHKTLSDDTCLNQRSILRLIVSLEKRGLLSRKARFRSNKSRTTDAITLHLGGDTMSGGGGDTVSGGVGTLTTKGGDMVSPPEPIEPLILTSRRRARDGNRAPAAIRENREPCADGRMEAKRAREAFAELAKQLASGKVVR